VTWEGSPQRELEYVEPTYLVQAYPDSPSDTPRFFTIEGANLKIRPVSSTSITLAYYEKIDALTDQATTNWLLTAHPDVYLFGALVEASAFGEGLDEAAAWAARLELGLNEVERLSQQSRGHAMIRAYGVTP
jgi:hypothetical protein